MAPILGFLGHILKIATTLPVLWILNNRQIAAFLEDIFSRFSISQVEIYIAFLTQIGRKKSLLLLYSCSEFQYI